jgi:uncharacterized protein YbjT (DUF2867 family)
MDTILVSGASGYIASRLIPRLLQAGYRVRCLARQPERLRRRPWYPQVETVPGDLTRPETLPAALQGVQVCYYLVHSMAAGRGYEQLDLLSARNFAQAARQAGVEQIIYLGGLADEKDNLAGHLRSRIESGAALREAGVPVTEFRAGVIVGPGSVSFEMIRFIAEQFPLMVGPAWARHKAQPIATQNVLDYLIAALTTPACRGKIIEIGGADIMTYAESMSRFAELRGLKRRMLLLPVVPAWFMAFFIDKLTPVHSSYALPLVEGLKHDSLVLYPAPPGLFPAIRLLDYAEAVRRTLSDLSPDTVEPVWLDLGLDNVEVKHEGMFIDYVRVSSSASAEAVFAAVCALGGKGGWPAWNWAWQLRGLLDRLCGGPGMRGRDESLRAGSQLDFYRVETLSERCLRLRAELKAPGLAWMEWIVSPASGETGCVLEQTAFFAPKGLPGFLYWYILNPIHRAVFHRLAQGLVRQAEKA